MKKSLIAAAFTFGLIGNAFAACDATPYNSPEELQPACVDEAAVVPATQPAHDGVKKKNQSGAFGG